MYSEVYVVKYLSDTVPIQNSMKNNIALQICFRICY